MYLICNIENLSQPTLYIVFLIVEDTIYQISIARKPIKGYRIVIEKQGNWEIESEEEEALPDLTNTKIFKPLSNLSILLGFSSSKRLTVSKHGNLVIEKWSLGGRETGVYGTIRDVVLYGVLYAPFTSQHESYAVQLSNNRHRL
jgi:hypothetical protein